MVKDLKLLALPQGSQICVALTMTHKQEFHMVLSWSTKPVDQNHIPRLPASHQTFMWGEKLVAIMPFYRNVQIVQL